MAIDRRRLLQGAASAGLIAGMPGDALSQAKNVYVSAATIDGKHQAVVFSSAGNKLGTIELPGRGHGGAFSKHMGHGVLFARRPGDFAIVFSMWSGKVVTTLKTPEGHHFCGHGTYAENGRVLVTTENDFERGRGVFGLWDVARGYHRAPAMPSNGIGPHDVELVPGTRLLAIANGGILTHPETGRRKLNIPDMEPNLTLVDARSGAPEAVHRLPSELHKLSVRHLAVNAKGVVAAAMQYEGPTEDRPPLVFTLDRDGLKLLEAPAPVQRRMKNYCGSIAMAASGEVMAVSCPRGGIVTFWSVETRELFHVHDVPDGCGLAATGGANAFLVSSGAGERQIVDPVRKSVVSLPRVNNARWDNHIASERV